MVIIVALMLINQRLFEVGVLYQQGFLVPC